jgi:hypothetical protein
VPHRIKRPVYPGSWTQYEEFALQSAETLVFQGDIARYDLNIKGTYGSYLKGNGQPVPVEENAAWAGAWRVRNGKLLIEMPPPRRPLEFTFEARGDIGTLTLASQDIVHLRAHNGPGLPPATLRRR